MFLYQCAKCQSVGARSPYRCNYKVGATKDGHIKSLELNILNNHVSSLNWKWQAFSSGSYFFKHINVSNGHFWTRRESFCKLLRTWNASNLEFLNAFAGVSDCGATLMQGAHFDFEYPDMSSILAFIDNAYNIPHWDIKGKVARTNLPACTYIRGPGKAHPVSHVCWEVLRWYT